MIHRVIVDGVDLMERFGLLLTYESTVQPPEPVTNFIDVPGMDGVLDLSESLTGDVNYSQRKQEFIFHCVGDPFEVEKIKTEVSNFLHGRKHEYQLTFDPEYVYTGRFSVNAYSTYRHRGQIRVEVLSDPWKHAETITIDEPAANGIELMLPNRRRRVNPTIQVYQESVVSFGGRSWMLEPGAWTIDKILLEPGENRLYVCTTPWAGTNTWQDVINKLGDVPFSEIAEMRLADLTHLGVTIPDTEETRVIIEYKTYDL